MTNKHTDLIFGLLMLGLAGALWLETSRPQYEGIEALNNGFPPSFYPRILLSIWAVLAGVIILKALAATGRGPRLRIGRLACAVLAVVGYVWALDEVGFLLASYAFTLIFMLVQGYRNARVVAAITVIFPTAAWWLMTGPMRISLPTSPWFDAF